MKKIVPFKYNVWYNPFAMRIICSFLIYSEYFINTIFSDRDTFIGSIEARDNNRNVIK